MNKVLGWILSKTRLVKVTDPVQKFLSGKKVYLAAAAIAIPALVTILSNFSDNGMAYLLTITHTPEYRALMEAIAGMALRAAVTKAGDPAKDPKNQSQVITPKIS